MTHDLDVAVIGGGPIGLAAGLALGDLGYRVRVFERRPAGVSVDDRRVLALSEGSRLILSRLGIWHMLPAPTPIARIHVSDAGHGTSVTLTAREAGVPALGYVTTFNALHTALAAQAQASGTAHVDHGVQARVLESDVNGVRVSLADATRDDCTAALVIHAEGGAADSARTARGRDYGQWALVAEVRCAQPARQDAYEHFTEHGPVALLPMDGHYALVWTVPDAWHAELAAADDESFCRRLSDVIGARTGPVTAVARRGAFPLGMRMAPEVTGTRTVWLGNAAQQLHPVAAQGFNLGLRDVWTLREQLWNRPADPGDAQALSRYARQRHADRQSSVFVTDTLVQVFGSTHPLLRTGRGWALRALRALRPLRNAFARRMMFGADS